jgi:hypothetical protein
MSTTPTECSDCGSHLFPTDTGWECAACLNHVKEPTEAPSKPLTDKVFDIIRDRVVPAARIEPDGDICIADYESVISHAAWLGYDISAHTDRLVGILHVNQLRPFRLVSLDSHRQTCEFLDNNLKTDKHRSGLEADLEFLKITLDCLDRCL